VRVYGERPPEAAMNAGPDSGQTGGRDGRETKLCSWAAEFFEVRFKERLPWSGDGRERVKGWRCVSEGWGKPVDRARDCQIDYGVQ